MYFVVFDVRQISKKFEVIDKAQLTVNIFPLLLHRLEDLSALA